VILGVILALAAAVTYNAGLILEKRALSALPAISLRRLGALFRVLCCSPGWLAGFGVVGVGLVCQVGALSLVPLSVAQPMQLAGLALLVVFSHSFLKERATPREWAGLGVLAVSLLLICLSLEPSRDKLGVEAHNGSMIVLALGTVFVGIAASMMAVRGGRTAPEVLYGCAAGLMYGVAGLQTKGVAGFLSQDSGSVITRTLHSPYPYVYVVASAAGLVLFQTGLQRGRASIVVPVATVVGNVYTVVAGTIAFDEPLPQDPVRLVLRVVGFLVATTVVLVLPRQPEATPGPLKLDSLDVV
jgi:drug/metabolite transporter (DMT)-like permease